MHHRTLSKLTLAGAAISALLAFPACHVKTGLPIGPQSISASDFGDAAATSQAGGVDDPTGTCEQEFGRDAGGKVRSAHTLGGDKIRGCLVQGDAVDMYLVHVPEDVEALTYRIYAISHDYYMRVGIYTMDGERLDIEHMSRGDAYRKNIQLEGGQSYKVIVRNHTDSELVRYTLQVAPSRVIAEN